MNNVTIEVTQVDIDRAKVKDSSRCVVATAIARSIPGAQRISVDVQSIRFTVGGERFVYLTPYSVSGYVVAFDAGDDIHPFKFGLRPDQQVNVRQTKKTKAGAEVDKARNKAYRAEKKAAAKQAQLEGIQSKELPPPAPAEVRRAKAEVRAAKEQAKTTAELRDEVVAAYAGSRQTEPVDTTKPKAPAQVFKKNERHYGHRTLRVNQDK